MGGDARREKCSSVRHADPAYLVEPMTSNRFAGAVLATSLIALGLSTPAAAQSTPSGFGVSRFEPSERGSDWFALESLDLRGHLRPAIGIVGEYQFRPLAIYESDGSVRTSLVRDLVVLHPGASLVLWDRVRFAFNLPVQVYANGDAGTLNGVTYAPPQKDQSLGDLRLGADVRLFGEYGGAITGAVGVQASLPTGDRDSYAGDGALRVAPRALIAGDIGAFVYAAKLGFQYRYHQATFAASPVGNELVYGASAGLRVLDRRLVVGPEVFGSAVTDGDQFFGRRTTPVEALLGAHYLAGDVRFGAGVGAGLTRGFGTPVVHALANVEWAPRFDSDRDKDGILDKDDACPDTAGVASRDPAKHGCPEELDRDRDGILDRLDACPDDPGAATDDPTTTGCPDRDKDGVVDKVDACPDVPGAPSSDPEKNGCPEELDRDKDGILDKVDACPDDPGAATNDPTTTGCPDRDKDGVVDKVDACPDEPGAPDPDPKKNGCPKAFIKDGKIMILEQVRFKTSSAEILPGRDSLDVLEAVLEVLKQHPEIKRVRVEGHTDDRGQKGSNQTLSANRAASVVKWLVAHGVDAKRLTSKGYGQDRPIDTNATDEGRQKNRRVEFQIDEEKK